MTDIASISSKGGARAPDRRSPTTVKAVAIHEWPRADQETWSAACRPAERLKRGGAASHMKAVTRADLVKRYGLFLDHVRRLEGLDPNVPAAAYVTQDRVERYCAELQVRVRSVTAYGSIYKLRRMAQLLAPNQDFKWLIEIETDLKLVRRPRSKFGRFVNTDVLVDAGLTLMMEAETATHRTALGRARQMRDGLMVALLALRPNRLKNFAALTIGRTFKQVRGRWWIVLPASETKEGRPDEHPVPAYLTRWIERYLTTYRPVLARTEDAPPSLWLTSDDGSALTSSAVAQTLSKATLATVGIAMRPHMFRTAAASASAAYAPHLPNLASPILNHTDPRVREEHYNRASSMNAANTYAKIIQQFYSAKPAKA